MNVTEEFCNYIATFSKNRVTTDLLQQARRCVIDYLGVVVGGAFENSAFIDSYLDICPRLSETVPVLGSGKKSDSMQAAYLNGINAHYLELDDGHRHGMLHLGSSIISAIIPSLYFTDISWDSFYRSIVVGYEAAIKLSRILQPQLKLNGYHATGVCGTVGAAVAIADVLDYDVERMYSTVAIAASSASGLLVVGDDNSGLKPLNIGQAAMTGLHAAMLGRTKIEPPKDLLGSRRGFCNVVAGVDGDSPKWIDLLRENEPQIMGIYFKPYASCRHAHPAIDAVIKMNRQLLELESILSIDVYTYKLAMKGHDHNLIEGLSSAKMSIPYGVACGIIMGSQDISAFSSESMQNPKLKKILSLISIHEDKEYSLKSPDYRAARVEIRFEDGSTLIEEVLHPKGEPENPMTDAEIENKMKTLFSHSLRDGESVIMALDDHAVSPQDLFSMCN